jgi:hypothetical protein
MWVRTQDDELVNLGNIEYIRAEFDEDTALYELRAYAFGWEPDTDDEEYYPLTSSAEDGAISQAMNRLTEALKRGDELLDFRGDTEAWTSS